MKARLINIVKVLVTGLLGFVVLFYLFLFFTGEGIHRPAPEATIKNHLSSMRVYAEVFKVESNSYEGFCESEEAVRIAEAIFYIQSEEKFLPVDKDTSYYCGSGTVGFEVYALLPNSEKYFCADSTGFAGVCDPDTLGEN